MTCSYSFQSVRSAHDALRAGIMDNGHGHLFVVSAAGG